MMAHFLVDLGSSSQQFNLLSECSWTVEVSRHGKVETANPLPPSWSLPLRKPSYTSSEDPYVVQGPPAVAASGHSFSLTPVFQTRQKGSETTDVGATGSIGYKGMGFTTPSQDKTKTVNPPAGSFSGKRLTITLEPYDMAKIEVARSASSSSLRIGCSSIARPTPKCLRTSARRSWPGTRHSAR